MWLKIKNNINCNQLHSVITKIKDLASYVNSYDDLTEEEADDYNLRASEKVLESIEFPSEFIDTSDLDGNTDISMPMAEKIRAQIKTLHDKFFTDQLVAKQKEEKVKETFQLAQDFKTYQALKTRFEKLDI